MEAVSNSTVIILFGKIRKLNLLDIYKIFTTPEIFNEIIEKKQLLYDERDHLRKYFQEKVQVENPKNILSFDLDKGESEALSLCTEKNIKLFLSDDKNARKVAEIISIKPIGCIGIIIDNLKEKKITKEEAKNILDLLVLNSYYLSTEAYAKAKELIDKF